MKKIIVFFILITLFSVVVLSFGACSENEKVIELTPDNITNYIDYYIMYDNFQASNNFVSAVEYIVVYPTRKNVTFNNVAITFELSGHQIIQFIQYKCVLDETGYCKKALSISSNEDNLLFGESYGNISITFVLGSVTIVE